MCDCPKEETIITLFKNFHSNKSDDDDENSIESWNDCEKGTEENSSEFLFYISDDSKKTKKSSGQLDACSGEEYEDECKNNNDPNLKWKVVAERLKIYGENEQDLKENADIEFTLAIIKPDALKYQPAIEKIIINEGFEICNKKKLQMTPEQMFEFYSSENGKESFPFLIAYMVSGPIVVLMLCKNRAVDDWRELIGPPKVSDAILYFPNSIRAKFGNKKDDYKNAVHGSSTYENAQEEIKFFFPNFIFEPILTGQEVEYYLWNNICHVLVQGITDCCKVKPKDPLLWLINWLLKNNPNKPRMLK